MEEISPGIEPDDLMEIDDGEASDLEEEEDELNDEPIPSPFQLPSSGPTSTATSAASSPPNNDDLPPPFSFCGKPLSLKRGRGRPRREGGKPIPRKTGLGMRLKRWKSTGFMRGTPRRVKGFERGDIEFSSISLGEESTMLDPETGALVLADRERLPPTPEDSPYPPEQWAGKVCAFCNLGERSQLGQGLLLRLICPDGFIPQRVSLEQADLQRSLGQACDREPGDKSPRGPVTCRRQKSFNKCRHPSMTSEYIDELTIIGYAEEPDVQNIFESSGYFYVHRNCASWAYGVVKTENLALQNVGPAALQSTAKKCSYCNHFGASLLCRMDGCSKIYHFPCATAAGAFQDARSFSAFCANHLSQVSLMCESAVCYTCKIHGDIANLMFCSVCGEHYHGTCVGLAQLPGVRSGWQCRKCKLCQVCRMVGDETKLMACEQCDKVYHSMCQRPTVATIPKYGWKCRCCRVCGDCGSRTPGAGLSSRWHAHYTVCDSCYQQRNKGFSCPLCHRAYRAHAHREMVQCALCRKFVHGTCDPEAEVVTYQQRKETHPEYEYVCLICKNLTQQNRQIMAKRNSIDEGGDSLSASHESLLDDNSEFDIERHSIEDSLRATGLGKGKPYSASKIAKKRLGLSLGASGRHKGMGKGYPGKVGFMKRQRLAEFGRKRGPKSKMRGMFGVPGVGLQRPISDGSKNDEEPGEENRLVLCSAKDKFVLTQDICVMCGALGTDQEGCLIGCVQCGQCYHPYCVNVKVTKVILQKGWRCLDCTVCEGCGQRNDEGRLILCDECDISYHIYCMDPPLDYVPHGNWKCKWCAICQMCGASDPGFNCTWMNSFSECGPCASHTCCPSCMESYNDGDLIIQCVQCERWLHAVCDAIKSEIEAEKCAEEGYNCILCRPRDVPPPHLLPLQTQKPPTPTKSPDVKSSMNYYVDGVYLSEIGNNLIKSLSLEQHITRKKRKKIPQHQDKEAGIMATIESVVAGSSCDNTLDDHAKLELVDVKEEPQDIYKEGMIWTKADGPPPDGFTVYTMETGVCVLRRKRQRNLHKLGIGGFLVRVRGTRGAQDNEDVDMLPGQTTPTTLEPPMPQPIVEGDKPRRKPARRKPKSKLAESFPSYLQDAFFGRELLDTTKEVDSASGSDEEKSHGDKDKTIQLSQDEIKAVAAVTAKQQKLGSLPLKDTFSKQGSNRKSTLAAFVPKEEDESDTEAFRDVFALPGDLLDTDLVNTIMNEDDDELSKNADSLGRLTGSNVPDCSDIAATLGNADGTKDTKDELTDILGSHFNIEAIPNINSKDVEDIFKGVLTDESQESQESNAFPLASTSTFGAGVPQPPLAHPPIGAPIRPTSLPTVNQNNLNSPMSFPPQSPYHSEYSNSPQFSPAFSEPPSPWVSAANDQTDMDTSASAAPTTYNQRSSEKMKADEGLGSGATISAVLYANMNHPEWKTEFPTWTDRYKQIIKKWRTLSTEQKAPYLQQARDNRSALRMKKQQQISKENASSPTVLKTTASPVISTPQIQPPVAVPVSEVCTHQSKPTPSLTSASTSSVSVSPPTTSRCLSQPSSPPTQHQFTVHGHFMGPGDHCGPAPNVTVNPLYQHSTEHGQTPIPKPATTTPAADQQIRVLTPSEIMRTLPSLSQESYEPQPLDQEKVALQQKSAREAEQERQWKQLQALRQQQAQQQQHVLHEQRSQAIAGVQRQLSDGQPFGAEAVGLQQVTTSQQLSPPSSPVPSAHHFFPSSVKGAYTVSPRSPTINQPTITHPFPTRASPNNNTQSIESNNPDSSKLSTTPRLQFTSPHPTLQGFTQPVRPGEGHEINRQLRDLLQRQQFKKLDEQLLPGKGQQRVWPPVDPPQEQETSSVPQSPGDATFRHPLPPPGIARPRASLSTSGIILRPPGALVGLRLPGADSRLQGTDFKMRLLLQQQQQRSALVANQQQQQFHPGVTPRFAQLSGRPTNVEQYENLLQKQQQPMQVTSRQPEQPIQVGQNSLPQRTVVAQQQPCPPTSTAHDAANNEQEIPDNVTAELEKLEQETGSMAELQAVGDILGGLEDDDELLAEMGADFNILEYADPELDNLGGGEKTNILDSLDLVEPEPVKVDKNVTKASAISKPSVQTAVIPKTDIRIIKSEPGTITNTSMTSTTVFRGGIQPPPLAVSQSQNVANAQQPQALGQQQQLTPQQQVHHQMLQQVQQAAAMGRPMAVGTKLMSPDGVIGVVMPNNTISLTFPPNYAQRLLGSHLQLQNQKLHMRLGAAAGKGPRMLSIPNTASSAMHSNIVGLGAANRMNMATPTSTAPSPAPPPPPYPGPPPPYPGSSNQMGLRMGPAPMRPLHLPQGLMHPMPLQGGVPMPQHLQRKPLLLQEQPLLLEDLLEQEKREQEKQLQSQKPSNSNQESSSSTGSALLSDHDFERLKADVFNTGSLGLGAAPQCVPAQGLLPVQNISSGKQQRPTFQARSPAPVVSVNQWQQNSRPVPIQTPQPVAEAPPRVPTFNATLLSAPPLPPENIITEQDRQAQVVYEQWLNNQNSILSQQLKYYETEVQKLRKIRKSLNSKQRQLRKSGNQLAENDALELQRISAEQAILQKHLESSRKQSRQHGMLIQEYRNKQQSKQRPGPVQSPLLQGQQNQSPLGHPSSSPIHHTPQSPMMSPSPSPMMAQLNSPLQSPSPMIPHSPGHGSVIQSPVNAPSGMSPLQPSPRIGTPHSQGEGSPGPVQSPSQICLPPPAPRMTSPQHRRVVTSPVGYIPDLRPGNQQGRFVRPVSNDQQQRSRLSSTSPSFLQRPGTPSPLNSPPPQQMTLSQQQQQLLQRQLQQQAFLQQNVESAQQGDANVLQHSQRALQLIQQRQLILRQQQLLQQQGVAQPPPLTAQQHQMMVQQQQQLAKQQQQQIAQMQAQQNRVGVVTQVTVNQPMPPRSPMINQSQQIMSPHSMHQPLSPMPPRSPMINLPSSPIARSMGQTPNSPMMHPQQQPGNSPLPRSPVIGPSHSPMAIRRPHSTSSSPGMPDRPLSVENPGTPRPSYASPNFPENELSGGGNPHSLANPIPAPPSFGQFGYFKLGLRGGAPMWAYGRGAKRIPTADKDDSANTAEPPATPKFKKESHLSKVSILKKKSPAKTNLQSLAVSKVGSLVSSDYNEFDDSSSTPPVTPPPIASTSRAAIQKSVGTNIPEAKEQVMVIDSSPEEKHIRCQDMMDYDDDNDTTVVSTEVSLNSAAQQADSDDITVIETFSQGDLTDVISSPLESDQITDEFLLFPVDLSGEAQYSDKEEDEEEEYSGELVDIHDKDMQIVNVAIQSPTTSEEELIMQGKTKKVTSDGLTLNIVQGLSNQLLAVTDNPDSPEQEEIGGDQSPEHYHQQTDEELIAGLHESEIVIVDPTMKSPEEQISTKEDFEELIEETRKEKFMKPEITKHINEIHKYAASVAPVQQTTITSISLPHVVHPKAMSPKISLISASTHTAIIKTNARLSSEVVLTAKPGQATSVPASITSIILPIKSTVTRSNIISVPKLVTSVSPAITIVSASTSQIASMLPSRFSIPVISASVVSKLPNVRVIDKPSSTLSLTAHDACLPRKIFDDESVSPDSSTCEEDKLKIEIERVKNATTPAKPEAIKLEIAAVKTAQKLDVITSKAGVAEEPKLQVLSNEPSDVVKEFLSRKPDTIQITKVCVREKVVAKPLSPVILQSTPELKMTAQVIQEKQASVHIPTRETISASFMTTRAVDVIDCNTDSDADSKSVVISIPSPTPSQEQMLDNMALQALEHRRRDGKGIPSEFDSFEDVLDMIENITAEPPSVMEPELPTKKIVEQKSSPTPMELKVEKTKPNEGTTETQIPVTVSTSGRPTVMPQLSPLSQPTELTTNMANVSQQLRTLLSSLHTTTVTATANVSTIVKSITHKDKVVTSSSLNTTTSAVHPRIVQHTTKIVPIVSGVTPSIMKHKTVTLPQHNKSNTVAATAATTTSTYESLQNSSFSIANLLPSRTVGGIHLMPDHPKLPLVTTVALPTPATTTHIITQVSTIQKTTTTVSSRALIPTTVSMLSTPPKRKQSLSLNAMLQSHPAATVPQTSPTTFTAASILGSAITIAKSSFSPSLVHAQPVVVSPGVTSAAHTITTPSPVNLTQQLDRNAYLRLLQTKSEDAKKFSIEKIVSENLVKREELRPEPAENPLQEVQKPNDFVSGTGCKYSTIQVPMMRLEDSQNNILLKQLLQNTACAGSQPATTSAPPTTPATTTAPSLPVPPNLEAQLARPVPPTSTPLLPQFLQNDTTTTTTPSIKTLPQQRTTIVSRETSFVSKPVQTNPAAALQQLHIDVKKCLPPSRTPSRDELLSPPTPRSTCSQDSTSLHTPPLIIKKEPLAPPQQSPSFTPQDVKKEYVDESSQHSEVSDQSRGDIQTKEEIDSLDCVPEKLTMEQKEELKKLKRRAYQQKRRQTQILNKEAANQPKKRPRKSSKVDEDYDTYMDALLVQLRNLPAMIVQEPVLGRNFGVVPIFGSGDLAKTGSQVYDSRFGDLFGTYGNALLPGSSDYYTTKPYGDSDPLPEKPPVSTQRGFYDQEFPLIKFDTDEDRKFELFCRDNDTPDSVVSSSSPECTMLEPAVKFPGLKLIDEDGDDDTEDEEVASKMRLSPVVPIITPIPIRLKPVGPYLKDFTDMDKENIGRENVVKSKFGSTPTAPLKDSGNVTVTLTLTSSAAEDIMGVLRDLANILHIPPPMSYQIVERTSTPPSQKLGLYRTKGKDGKEGAPIDIQSILNGAAKFCKHCDVVILNNMIRKKISEIPILSKDTELLGDGDELFFCSSTCYMQFAIAHRSPSISEDKAAAIVDHLCQKGKQGLQNKAMCFEKLEKTLNDAVVKKFLPDGYNFCADIKKEIGSEAMESDDINSESIFMARLNEFDHRPRKHSAFDTVVPVPAKVWRGLKYKYWSITALQSSHKFKKPTDKEIMELLYRLGITVTPSRIPEDTRRCMFCQNIADGVADGAARLLNFDVDKWVHLNCGLWSDGVYETVNGALMNLQNALQQSLATTCIHCNRLGATIRCFKTRCSSIYHLPCAVKDGCIFYKNKTIYCPSHVLKNEKDNELTTLSVCRRVYVNRDENRQVAAVMHHSSDTSNLLRVGSLIFLCVGQLLPHQLQNFHTSNYIYPIGYKIVRFYWSMRRLNKRCRYVCSIHDVSGRPEFRVLVQDPPEDDLEFRDGSPKGVWVKILEAIAYMRRDNQCIQIFPKFVTGEDLFGLTEPAVVRVLESLPGIETLTDYKFKYGRNPLLELPLAINPSGAARTEPKLRNQLHWKRPHTQRTGSSVRPVFVTSVTGIGEAVCPYSKQFVHSKSSQYKKMKQEWRNNVYLARSKIQGLGLYAARDLEKHTMVIEYIGEIIRTELAETREKQYEAKNRGIYMFRLDEERVIDATLSGGLARYINHSCNPNCVAEIVEVDRDLRIIIFAKRRIQRGEELAYDYKFDIEDDQHKISCMCGAPNCRKWMN